MATPEQLNLLDELQDLLGRQLDHTQQGNITGVEQLAHHAQPLVEKVAAQRLLELPEFKDKRDQLQKLYADLYLAVAVHKADVSDRLNRMRTGRKTVETYLDNISFLSQSISTTTQSYGKG